MIIVSKTGEFWQTVRSCIVTSFWCPQANEESFAALRKDGTVPEGVSSKTSETEWG